MKLSGQIHVPAALAWGPSPRGALSRSLGGTDSRSGCFGVNKACCGVWGSHIVGVEDSCRLGYYAVSTGKQVLSL